MLTGPDFESIGPMIEDIVIHAETNNLSSQFEYRVAVQRRFRNGDWTPAPGAIGSGELVLSLQSADGYAITSTPFNDRSKFGYRTRLVLQYHSKQTGGGAVGANAELNLVAAVRFFTR